MHSLALLLRICWSCYTFPSGNCLSSAQLRVGQFTSVKYLVSGPPSLRILENGRRVSCDLRQGEAFSERIYREVFEIALLRSSVK